MAIMGSTGETIIGDHNWQQFAKDHIVNGERKARGLIPRDYGAHPPDMFDPPTDMPLIPESEHADRLEELKANGALLSQIRMTGNYGKPMASLDQNGQGFCWAYSTTNAVMLDRAVRHMPYMRLSAHCVGCLVKDFQDEGGWCGLSAQFHRKHGCASIQFWKEQSMSRSNDTPEMHANAALHRVTEDWVDMTREVYDQNLSLQQLASLALSGIPHPTDYNWWGHSVCALDIVNGTEERHTTRDVTSGKLLDLTGFDIVWGMNTPMKGWGRRIWNSWGDSWSVNGTGVLTGNKAIPDGAVAIRVSGASTV